MTTYRCPTCGRTVDALPGDVWCMQHPYPHEAKKPARMVPDEPSSRVVTGLSGMEA